MMGRQGSDQSQLFYLFNLERRIPQRHLLRQINPFVTQVLGDLRRKLEPLYSDIGRPSIDPELMIRMLIVGYCYGVRSERKLCEEVELHLAYRWFCRLDLDDKVPDHSTFSVNRHGRFRDGDVLRQVFEAVVHACMDAGPRRPRDHRRRPSASAAIAAVSVAPSTAPVIRIRAPVASSITIVPMPADAGSVGSAVTCTGAKLRGGRARSWRRHPYSCPG
jgi:transposase